MPYVADVEKAKKMDRTLVGDGQCVTFVHAAVQVPSAYAWRKGVKVRGKHAIRAGTAIATFDRNGRYANYMGGSSHAAIYLGQDGAGIRVLDQWNDRDVHPVRERTIHFKNGQGLKADDEDQYYVVE